MVEKLVCAVSSTSPVGPTCRVINTWESARAIFGERDALGKRVGSCIYLSPTYTEIWWRHYGRGRLLIVECRCADVLVGVLPIFVSTIVAGIIPVAVARLLTSVDGIVVITPPVEPGSARACWAMALRAVLEAGAEVVAIGPLSGENGYSDEARAAILESGLRLCSDYSSMPHTIFNLPESMDAYYAMLDRKTRGNVKRAQRNLQKMGVFKIRFASNSEAPVFFERFIRLHTERWNASKRLGHFGDWPGSAAFNAELVRAHAARGEAFFFEIWLDEKIVGAEYAYIYGSQLFARLPARAVGSKWDDAGLGHVIQTAMIEAALERGVRRIQSGPGHYPNKLRAGGTEFPLIRLLASRQGIVCSVKAWALKTWSTLWNYAYYRGWRARLLPKLGIKPGPLSRIWIQTRC